MALNDDVKGLINDPAQKAKDALSAKGTVGSIVASAIDSQLNPNAANGKVDQDSINQMKGVRMRGGLGEISSAATMAYYGLNHRGNQNPIQSNTDLQGLTFFTRPRLNLSYDNILRDRMFSVLATQNETSMPRAIRAWLDHVGAIKPGISGHPCPLVDEQNPFITLLTNNLVSLSGWPDPYTESFTSDEGVYKENWCMIDGTSKIYWQYTLNATFRNIVDDPISMLFNIWTQYASRVYEGTFMPHPDAIFSNYIDYQTRIYRLVLDKSRTYVQKIACCGAAYPEANNLGQSFNFNQDKPYLDELDQISVTFRSMGAIYNDPIVADSFNRTSYIFNPLLSQIKTKTVTGGQQRVCAGFIKLQPDEKLLFNYFGYPQINLDTMELEWWVKEEDYKNIMAAGGITTTTGEKTAGNTLSTRGLPAVETPAFIPGTNQKMPTAEWSGVATGGIPIPVIKK